MDRDQPSFLPTWLFLAVCNFLHEWVINSVSTPEMISFTSEHHSERNHPGSRPHSTKPPSELSSKWRNRKSTCESTHNSQPWEGKSVLLPICFQSLRKPGCWKTWRLSGFWSLIISFIIISPKKKRDRKEKKKDKVYWGAEDGSGGPYFSKQNEGFPRTFFPTVVDPVAMRVWVRG